MFLDIEYNGIKGSGMQVYAQERPSIPAARMRREEITIPGGAGHCISQMADTSRRK